MKILTFTADRNMDADSALMEVHRDMTVDDALSVVKALFVDHPEVNLIVVEEWEVKADLKAGWRGEWKFWRDDVMGEA